MEDERWFLASQAHLTQALADAGMVAGLEGKLPPLVFPVSYTAGALLPPDEALRVEAAAALISRWLNDVRARGEGHIFLGWRDRPELTVIGDPHGVGLQVSGRAFFTAPAP
jgi:hypothetical protein